MRDGARVLLLHQLGEDAFEVGKAREFGQFGWFRVGEDPAPGNHNDAVADLFDGFKDVGDVENGFAFGGEQFQQMLEQP